MKINICNRIKELRRKHDFSQEEVAERLNMSQNAYSQIESGKTKLDIERLCQVAEFYKISLYILLDDLPPRNNKHSPGPNSFINNLLNIGPAHSIAKYLSGFKIR